MRQTYRIASYAERFLMHATYTRLADTLLAEGT